MTPHGGRQRWPVAKLPDGNRASPPIASSLHDEASRARMTMASRALTADPNRARALDIRRPAARRRRSPPVARAAASSRRLLYRRILRRLSALAEHVLQAEDGGQRAD